MARRCLPFGGPGDGETHARGTSGVDRDFNKETNRMTLQQLEQMQDRLLHGKNPRGELLAEVSARLDAWAKGTRGVIVNRSPAV